MRRALPTGRPRQHLSELEWLRKIFSKWTSTVLSTRACQGLKSYKYKAGGYTWLDEAHNPVWNWLVNLLPIWLAPNLITLTGTLFIVAAYMINIVYNPDFTSEAPTWVYMFTCASVAIYVNLDCMDGKQARRTGSSSPLGQLFDHGCDALALHMMLANISSSMGVPCGWKMAISCLGVLVPWVLAQWEEYHTGIMMYGNDFYGVLEANYSICAVHLVSTFLGFNFWKTEMQLWPLGQPVTTGQTTVVSASVGDVALVLVAFGGVMQGISNVARVMTGPPLATQEVGYKPTGKAWALAQLLGLLLPVLMGAWAVTLAGTPSLHNEPAWLRELLGTYLSAAESRAAFSMWGILYAHAATQFIIAHMSKEPWTPSLAVLGFPSVYVVAKSLGSPHALAILLVLHACALVLYSHYVISVISQICAFLGIRCLTIPSPATK